MAPVVSSRGSSLSADHRMGPRGIRGTTRDRIESAADGGGSSGEGLQQMLQKRIAMRKRKRKDLGFWLKGLTLAWCLILT